MASEAEARRKVLATYRGIYPNPTSCDDAIARLPKLEEQLTFDKEHGSKVNGPRWVEAGTQVIKEFNEYIAECNKYDVPDTIPTADSLGQSNAATNPSPVKSTQSSKDTETTGGNTLLIVGGVSALLIVVAIVVIIKSRKK